MVEQIKYFFAIFKIGHIAADQIFFFFFSIPINQQLWPHTCVKVTVLQSTQKQKGKFEIKIV